MASLRGVTDQLQRQNQMELASVVRLANEQLTSSGARQGLDEITKIFEAQQGTSLKEFKATKQQIDQMRKDLAKLDGVNSAEKRVLEQVLKTSQASIGENVTFKKSIGELASNTVEQSIDSIGGTIAGSLSGSPLLAFGASFVGDRFAQFKENKKAAKEAQKEREDKIAQENALEEREFALLRDQMDNEKVARLSGKTQSEIDSLTLEQLEQEKNIIIQKAKAAKQEADLRDEERKNIEDVQSRFGLDFNESESNTSVPPRGSSEIPETGSINPNNLDLTRTNELLENIDSRLHGSPDYLATLNDKIDILIKDDPTSLEIESERELKRHQKKLEENGRAQIQATSSAAALTGGSGEGGSGGFGDFAKEIAASVLGVGGLGAGALLKNKLFPSKTPPVSGVDPSLKSAAQIEAAKQAELTKNAKSSAVNPNKPTAQSSRLQKFLGAAKKIPKVGNIVKAVTAAAGAMTVAQVASDVIPSSAAAVPDPVVTGRPVPLDTPSKPSLLSRTKEAIVNKLPFKSPSAASLPPAVPPPASLVTKGTSAAMTGLKTTGRILSKAALPLTLAIGALETASVLSDDEKSSDQKVNAVAGIGGGMGGAAAGATAGAVIGSVVPIVGTVIGGLIGGGLGYFAGEFLGKETAELAGFSADDATVNDQLQINADRKQELKDLIAEKKDAIMRSENGENVYWGKEAGGIRKDKAEIKKLQEEQDKLNISPEEIVPKMPEDQPPRPTAVPGDKTGSILKSKQEEWDAMYGDTHNKDGSPKIPEKSESGTTENISKPMSAPSKEEFKVKTMFRNLTEDGSGEMTKDEIKEHMKSGKIKRSIGNKFLEQISLQEKTSGGDGTLVAGEKISSDTSKLNTNLAASETMKSSALEKNTVASSNNVVASGNTNNTSVNTTNNNVTQRMPSVGVRNPEQTAAQMRHSYALNNF